jgi:alanine racemase
MAASFHDLHLGPSAGVRPTHVRVDLDVLADNYAAISRYTGRPIMPVLKANAYGHGLVVLGRLYQALRAPLLGVAYVEEGLQLRAAGVTAPVLVLGGLVGDQIPAYLQHDLIPTASSVDKLRALEAAAGAAGRVVGVHLKFDTGMERIGVHWYSAGKLLEAALECPHIRVEGVFSHLACSDEPDHPRTAEQIHRFQGLLAHPALSGLRPLRHLANSGGVLHAPDAWMDLVRPGILLYGVYPDPSARRTIEVRPALSWWSRVVYFKVVRAGNPVSYGGTWAPQRDTRVVTLPVGYGDGYMRRMSGRAKVVLRGRELPVVGRICMDQVMVDLGPDGTAYNGDEVQLLGAGGPSAEDLANWADTIAYEVLTSINNRVPRVYTGRWAERLGVEQR